MFSFLWPCYRDENSHSLFLCLLNHMPVMNDGEVGLSTVHYLTFPKKLLFWSPCQKHLNQRWKKRTLTFEFASSTKIKLYIVIHIYLMNPLMYLMFFTQRLQSLNVNCYLEINDHNHDWFSIFSVLCIL